MIHIEESKKKKKKTSSKARFRSSATPRSPRINGVCWHISMLSDAQRKHLSRAVNTAEETRRRGRTVVTLLFPYITSSSRRQKRQTYWFQSACCRRISRQFDRVRLFRPLVFTVIRNKDAHDRDVYGGTEIEMSNYPASLTHIRMSSCGQAVHNPPCRHRRARRGRIWFCKLHLLKSA